MRTREQLFVETCQTCTGTKNSKPEQNTGQRNKISPVLVVELRPPALPVANRRVAALLLRVLHVCRERGLERTLVARGGRGNDSIGELVCLQALRLVCRVHPRVEQNESVPFVQHRGRVTLVHGRLERFDARAVYSPGPGLGGDGLGAVSEGGAGEGSGGNGRSSRGEDGADRLRSGHRLAGGHGQRAAKGNRVDGQGGEDRVSGSVKVVWLSRASWVVRDLGGILCDGQR